MTSDLNLTLNLFGLNLATGSNHIYMGYVMVVITLKFKNMSKQILYLAIDTSRSKTLLCIIKVCI